MGRLHRSKRKRRININNIDKDFILLIIDDKLPRDSITLLCMANDINKTQLMRELLEEWIAVHGTEEEITKAIRCIAERKKQQWQIAHANYKTTLKYYTKRLECALHKKGVSSQHIQDILTLINDGTS